MNTALRFRTAAGFLAVLCRATLEHGLTSRRNDRSPSVWLHRWSRAGLQGLRISVCAEGEMPAGGLIVCNHLSYIDVLVLSSVAPCAFVSKKEVAGWPVVGRLTHMAGTIYLKRESPKDARRVNQVLQERLARGERIVIFPEGTSSDGTSVLPFRPSLFQSAIDSLSPVTPVRISYTAGEADPATDVCYWGAMTFLTHLWKLFGIARIEARVQFGRPAAYPDRKTAARESRDAILRLACS